MIVHKFVHSKTVELGRFVDPVTPNYFLLLHAIHVYTLHDTIPKTCHLFNNILFSQKHCSILLFHVL